MARCFPYVALLLAALAPALAVRRLSSVAAGAQAGGGEVADALSSNPIRKVVTLLQNMAKKVEKEADEEKELYEKFACYCQNGGADLKVAIGESNVKVPALQSEIEESQSTVARLKQELIQHQTDRAAAKEAMAAATSLREKDNAVYAKESGELKQYTNALAKAIPAIRSGMSGGAFMQLGAGVAAAIQAAMTADTDITGLDRNTVLAFLAGRAENGYVPKGGEIVGILENMKESFDKSLAEVETQEAESVKVYDQLIAAKTKEVETLGSQVEKKTARVGELGMQIVRMQGELTTTEAALIENTQFMQDLEKDCETKKAEMEDRVKMRGEELVAIYDTIKILNSDDALDLFKKTLPSASLLQLRKGTAAACDSALALLRRARTPGFSAVDVRFLELALMGRKVDFSKVVKMIDEMVALLVQEQADDDNKQEYCQKQLDATGDKLKDLSRDVEGLEMSVDERAGLIKEFEDEIKTGGASIKELDRLVMDATTQRKAENEEFSELMSSDNAAKELLNFAKTRLNKFYNPKLVTVKEGEAAPEGAVLLAIKVRHSQAPGPPPPTGSYEKKGGETTGVIAMIDLLIRDLDKEMTEAKKDEEHSQQAYEELMADSAAKRAKDTKALGAAESSKADEEQAKIKDEGDLDSKKKEHFATGEYRQQIHAECDWLLQNFDLRKEARAEESDNLKKAKAILAGADFSFLQAKH